MKPVIEIRNLGKEYKRGAMQPYLSLRDSIAQATHFFTKRKSSKEAFWAIKDISFDVQQGERIGIIGKNGAGKSTLLKILSKITPPTRGSATIKGRVGSLLEVGTGFHPELTGRENIFLNGSILGLRKSEINRQLDAIIDFSGVEKFIDTPVKHYSTGMQLRLAFAVAAHLEPEILIIDEVLAVGDAEFQKKCVTKMGEVSRQDGRTILFVSHQMNFISSLCTKTILLEKGELEMFSSTPEVISHYFSKAGKKSNTKEWISFRPGDDVCRLISLQIVDEKGQPKDEFRSGEPIGISMTYEVLQPGYILWLGHNINTIEGVHVFDTHSVSTEYYNSPHEMGTFNSITWIPANLLNTGSYLVGSAIFNHLRSHIHFHVKDVIMFMVYDDIHSLNAKGSSPGQFPGIIRPLLNWQIRKSQV